MKLTITNISRKDSDKEGKKYIGKNGRPYTRLGLKTVEYGERWLSGFGRQDNASWKVGDEVEVEVEEKGEYLNFSMPERPKLEGFTIEDRDRLIRVEAILQKLLILSEPDTTSDGAPMPNFD